MLLLCVYREVGDRLTLTVDLGTHADAVGMQGASGQPRPVSTDLFLEAREPAACGIIEGVVDTVAPLDIGAEAGAACHIEC